MNTVTLIVALLIGADPAADPATPAAPAAASPAAISVSPRAVIGGDETAMVGQIAELTATDSERAKSYKWLIRPKPTSVKNAKPDGSAIFVSNREPAIFEVELVVSSAEGQIDVAIGELEIVGDSAAGSSSDSAYGAGGAAIHQSRVSAQVSDVSNVLSMLRELHAFEQTLGPQPQMGMPHGMMPAMTPGMAPGMATMMTPTAAAGHPVSLQNAAGWPQGVKVLANRVASNTRAAEGAIVSGCFRTVANQIKTGTFSGKDPWYAANLQAREALGNAYAPWQPFFADLLKMVSGAKSQGRLIAPQDAVLHLEGTAEALGSL